MKKIKILILIIITVLLLLIGFFIFHSKKEPDRTPITTDESADDWNGKQDLSKPEEETPMIAIPGITSLVFDADATTQKVNFYNPEENDCLFRMTLFIGATSYWQSGYVESGKGYYEIELDNPISAGEYDAHLLVECFTENGDALNSANVEFSLTVE